MRLADWILDNMEEILQAWERDARKIFPTGRVSKDERRDHARVILPRTAAEMEQSQTARRPAGKAKEQAFLAVKAAPAQGYGPDCMDSGTDAVELVSEYRALRMSALQLWARSESTTRRADVEDVVRFNQAIDKALAESMKSFALDKEKHERLFHALLASLPDPSYILDPAGRFIYANKATTELYATSLEQLVGKTFADLALPLQEDLHGQLKRVVQDRTQLRGEVMMGDASGHRHCYEYLYVPVVDDQDRVEAIVGTARDITQYRQSEAQIWHHANYDPLTELPNRRLFRDRLDQQTRHSERTGAPFALFFIDLDQFKEVNDLLGHDVGDLLLTQAADRIRCCVREADTVARLGGDEFTVILLDIDDLEQIQQIARNILAELRKPFYLEDDVSYVSGSIGITRHPHDAKTSQQLLKNADQAMYAAKKSGRDQFCCFAQIMEQTARERAQLANELREAAAWQQLRLYYQPIVDLADGRIAKAEALLRWRHPTRGLLLPAAFLKLAEETGLISNLETWAFAEAAACSKHWNRRAGPPFQVSLNVSSVRFSNHRPAIPWGAQLEEIGLSGDCMTMELTEKIFAQDVSSLAEKLATLEEAGITLALDDFGTGHSSLADLKKLNIAYLKIDPSFVRGEQGDGGSRAVAETIILMAHRLGLQVIAEGVETRQQKDWLQAAGCDYAQGFFFSEPLPTQAFEALLASGYIEC